MNEPECRAYRAAILPTFLPSSPKFNLKTKPNTNLLLQTPRTLNYRRAARHRQPSRSYPNYATLTTRPAGLPHRATWASLPDTGAWTIARNCPIAQVRYTLYNGAALSAVRFLLSTTPPGRRRRHLFLKTCHVFTA